MNIKGSAESPQNNLFFWRVNTMSVISCALPVLVLLAAANAIVTRTRPEPANRKYILLKFYLSGLFSTIITLGPSLGPLTESEREVFQMHNNFRESVRTGSVKGQPAGPLVKGLVSYNVFYIFYFTCLSTMQ